MIKIINSCTLIVLLSLLTPLTLFAEEPELTPNHPTKYYVKEGDTLWDISQIFLKNPWAWSEIWHINNQVADPHLIYPGDEISLVYVDRSEGTDQGPAVSTGKSGEQKPALMVTKRDPGAKTIKLSPEKRASQISSTIPTIPLTKVESFLTGTRVLDRLELSAAPYVIAADQRHMVMGQGDLMYAMGDWSKPQNAYGVYRAGSFYVDPDTQEVLGYEAQDLGIASFISEEDGVATFRILRADKEIREYDKLLPTETKPVEANFYPKTPNGDIKGQIIRVFSGVKNIGQYDVVVINRGVREGVETGDVFAIYRTGMIVRDKQAHNQKVKLPDEKSGLLMIFKTHEKVSLGLVLNAKSILSIGDRIQKP